MTSDVAQCRSRRRNCKLCSLDQFLDLVFAAAALFSSSRNRVSES